MSPLTSSPNDVDNKLLWTLDTHDSVYFFTARGDFFVPRRRCSDCDFTIVILNQYNNMKI